MRGSICIVSIFFAVACLVVATGDALDQATPKATIKAVCENIHPGNPSVASGAIAFATRLAELGSRPAAGEGEARTRLAVAAELEAIGLEVTTEPFEYQTFSVDKITLDLGGEPAEPLILGFDPFANAFNFSGESVVVTDPAQAGQSLKGRIVVTNHPLMQLMISEFEPAVVICVAPEDLEAFVDRGILEVSLEIRGNPLVLRSANVVARYAPRRSSSHEILVTSHLDAYQDSPGANDNGTGLGLMIELARAFAKVADQLDVSIAFAAFGAEENGAIGSRAYVRDHMAELADVVAVVNLDTLGGALGPVIATKPSEKAMSQVIPGYRVPDGLRGRAWEGPTGQWRMIHPEIIPAAFTSYYPEWLHEVVIRSSADLEIEVVHRDLISDHRTFALAGVPAISIQSKEHQIHSKKDTADALVPETIASGAMLATKIICELQTSDDKRVHLEMADRPVPPS